MEKKKGYDEGNKRAQKGVVVLLSLNQRGASMVRLWARSHKVTQFRAAAARVPSRLQSVLGE